MEKPKKRKSANVAVETDNISLSIIQLVHDAIIVVDEDQDIILFNQGAEKTFGYIASEVIGQRLDVLLPPQVSEIHNIYLRGFAKTPGNARLTGKRQEISGRRKDGTIFPAEASIAKVSIDGRTVFTAIFRDITERVRKEEETHLQLALTRAIAEADHFDSALSIAIQMICEITGWDFGEVWLPARDGLHLEPGKFYYCKGKKLEKFRTLSERFKFESNISLPGRVLASRKTVWIPDVTTAEDFERAAYAREAGLKAAVGIPVLAGKEVVAVMNFFLKEARPEDKNMVTLISTVAAELGMVFAHRQTGQKLRESEEAQRRVLNGIDEIVYQVRYSADNPVEGVVEFVSERAQEVLGHRPSEFITDPQLWFSLIHPEDVPTIRAKTEKIMKTGLPGLREYRIKDMTGEYRWMEDRVAPEIDEAGQMVRIFGVARDITERKRAEEQLIYQAALLANVNDAIVASDAQYRLTAWNAAAEALYGWKAEEVLGRNGLEIVRTEWPATSAEEMRRTITKTGRWRGEATQARKDGTRIPVEVSSLALRDDSGQITGYVSVNRDITERKQAEEALRLNEARFRALTENSADGIAVIGENNLVTYQSPAVTQMLGYSPDERIGHNPFEFIHPDDLNANQEKLRRLLQKPGEREVSEVRFQHRDGSWRWLEVTGTNLVHDPAVRGIVANYRDITERKQAEESLRESEERYRLLVELSPVAIFVHSHGALLFANMAGAAMLGAAHPDELMGKSLLDFIHTDHRHELAMRAGQIEQAGSPRHQEETQFVAADGRTVYAEVSSAPITYRGQAARLAIVRDITKRRQAEKELAERSQLLEAFFANTLTGIVLLDRDFNFIRVNEAYARAGARDVSDFPGHNHFEFYPSDAQSIFEDVVKTKKSFQIFARPFVFPDHPDWETTYWDWTLVPILDNADEVEFLVFTLNDVSERVRAEAERRKLTSAVEQTDAGVMIVNRQGVIEFVNAALERIAGHSRQDLLGQTLSALQSGAHSKEFYAGLWRTINAGESFHSVFTDKTKEGKHIHVDQTISPIKDAQGSVTHFVSVWKDITEQVQAEQERERLFEQAQAGSERLRNLSQQLLDVQETERRRIALELHDEIGQTLTGLRLSLELPARLPVEAAAARLAQARTMVDELLRYVENLALDLRPSMLDDLGLLPALLWQIERYSTRTGVRVNCKHTGLDRRFPPEIETAAFRIVQEALTNTARHAGVDDVTVRLWATPEILGLQVEDGGSGFDPKEALSVGATSGLSGMRERALLSGGRFEIESEPGNGTRLTVELPLGGQLEKREQS